MDLPYSVEILEYCNVSPPNNSVPTSSIPITFFDIEWLLCPPIEHLLFYEFPHPTLHFTEAILPQLKHSLALTLQHFFPLAGSMACPPLPNKPYILYQNGDSIPLTITESNNDIFAHLVGNSPKDVREFRPLVPQLSNELTNLSSSNTDQVQIQLIRPLIALQVTIFPNSGISICLSYRHVVGDGRTMSHFFKSWASICKSKYDLSVLVQPFHNREVVNKDLSGLLPIVWDQWCELGAIWENVAAASTIAVMPQDSLHATFIMNRLEINKLRHWITSQFNNEAPPLPYASTFVIASAFTWVCLIKTEIDDLLPQPTTEKGVVSSEDDALKHFGFAADCANRKDFNVPKAYLGNCMRFCCASVRKSELLRENGLFTAVKGIMRAIQELDGGLLRGAERWMPNNAKIFRSGHVVTVSSSPKLRFYETDFGWGRPRKSDIVSIDKSPARSISLTECRDDEGGVEIGLALTKAGMEAFMSNFERGLKDQCF